MRDPFIVLTITLLPVAVAGLLTYDDYNKPDVIVDEDDRDRPKTKGSARGLYNPDNMKIEELDLTEYNKHQEHI